MAIRKIRLTESQLTRLIGRIVEETEKEMDSEITKKDDEREDNKMFRHEEDAAIKKIAEFLKSEVLPDLSPRQINKLKEKVGNAETVSENIYEEDDEDLSSRKASRREKMMMRGGLGMSAVGAVAALGEFMGYSEFETTTMIHDINHLAGLDRYTGPVTVAMVFAGLVMALRGRAKKYERTGK
jgi:hypothetical protein